MINPRRAKKAKKKCCFFCTSFYIIFLGKINILKNHITFAHLIKGTVLGRVLWGANTFLTRNRLSNPKSVFSQTLLFFMVFHSFL